MARRVPVDAFKPVIPPTSPRSNPRNNPRTAEAATAGSDFDREARSVVPIRPALVKPAGPTHVIEKGDTLWQVAAWHRADLDAILRWNPRVDPRTLRLGARILVPGGERMPARPRAVPRRVVATSTVRSTPRSTPAPAPTQTSGHRWPLPVKGLITTRFSSRHPGIDIAAPSGTTVRAIAGGKVVWAGWKDNGGGYVVVIRHPDGMVSTYNHNREVTVERGQVVEAGQRIARVGATGRATGPHLDLRIEMNDRLIDPLKLY